MVIKLQSLRLENFKGIKSLTIYFEQVTSILGENAIGKTTIFDAFTWLLWGKDGRDNKDFNIKTLDSDGKAIPQIDHSVEGILPIDGSQVKLRRLYREKWTRRRGEEESALTGHETLFYWNEVPLLAGEYKTKIEELIDEGLFKLLTSTVAFNSMKWQDRRQVLVQIAGDIGNADIMKSMKKDQVKDITDILNSGKPMEEYRKEIVMRKKKLDNDLKLIPSRIDEVQRGLPEEIDFEKVQVDINEHLSQLKEIETAINDQVATYKEKGEEIQKKQQEVFNLKKQLQSLEFEAKSEWQKQDNARSLKIQNLQQKIQLNKGQLDTTVKHGTDLLTKIDELKTRIAAQRKLWGDITSETFTFDKDECICPTCKRKLDEDDIISQQEQLCQNFEESKSKKLSSAITEGRSMSLELQDMEEQKKEARELIDKLTFENMGLNQELEEIGECPAEPTLDDNQQHKKIVKQIETLELQILEVPKLDVESLKMQNHAVREELDALRVTMATKDTITRGKARISELLDEEKSLAQQISTLEKSEFAMDAYTRSKMDLVETRVNEKFKLVRFKMFNVLLNLGIEECCETTLGGIPYADVNSAGKIQAGVDIINTLTEHYGIMAPIFADNAETVNEMPETKSQLIKLIVTKDKELIIK